MKQPWHDKLLEEATNREGWFAVSSLAPVRDGEVSAERALQVLVEEGLALGADPSRLVTRRWFFRQARVLAKPLAWEIDAGVLVPGHRFLPFYSPVLPPVDIELIADGESFDRRTVVRSVRDSLIHFSVFGEQSLMEVLLTEDEANRDIPLDDDGSTLARLSAFDMTEFYIANEFTEGDFLSCRLLDFENGRFECSYLPATHLDPVRKESWAKRMDKGFAEVYDLFGRPTDPELQVAYAYFFAGRRAVTSPGLNLGGYLSESEVANIVSVGSARTAFWHSQLSPDRPLDVPPTQHMTGTVDDLESILNDIGSSVSPGTIEASMRVSLSNGEGLSSALDRCFEGADLVFYDEQQQLEFGARIDELWQQVSESHDAERDAPIAELRRQFLDVITSFHAWLRDLDHAGVDPRDLPSQPIRELGEATSHVEEILSLLNDLPEIGSELLSNLEDAAEALSNIIDEKVELVDDHLAGGGGPSGAPDDARGREMQSGGREVQRESVSGRDSANAVVQLVVTIEDLHLPVWRRLRVPGGYDLHRMHSVIQAAFDWQDEHHHMFEVGGTRVGDPDAWEEVPPGSVVDERTVFIGEFEVEDRITYTYDFGDNWVHSIVIEKTLDPGEVLAEDSRIARCLDGFGAAPPEDCGGPPGFRRLVEAMGIERRYRLEEDGLLVDWFSDFDPDHFDIEETNDRLRRA